MLGLVALGIHVHPRLAAKSREQVEEAQLARVLLQRIADDLRNAVPFQPPASQGGSSSSGTYLVFFHRWRFGDDRSLGARARAVPTLPARPARPTRRTPVPRRRFPAGIYGSAHAIQIETLRRPHANPGLVATGGQRSQPACPAQRHSRRLLQPRCADDVDMSQESPPSASGTGLYRHGAGPGRVLLRLAKRPDRRRRSGDRICSPRRSSISSSPTTAARPAPSTSTPASAGTSPAGRPAARRPPAQRPAARPTPTDGQRHDQRHPMGFDRNRACCPPPCGLQFLSVTRSRKRRWGFPAARNRSPPTQSLSACPMRT